jgi:hypothetical protein
MFRKTLRPSAQVLSVLAKCLLCGGSQSNIQPCDDGHDEEHPRQVAEEGNEPVFQEVDHANTTVEEGSGKPSPVA